MIKTTLAQIARDTVVTIDDGIERESGMALLKDRVVQIAYASRIGGVSSLIALTESGRLYEQYDGATAWNEVEVPR